MDCATQALEKYNIEKDVAAYIKKEFDKKYNPTWHCIVGRNFGSYVTHETKHFIYFYLGKFLTVWFVVCHVVAHPSITPLYGCFGVTYLAYREGIFCSIGHQHAHFALVLWLIAVGLACLLCCLDIAPAGQVAILLFKSG